PSFSIPTATAEFYTLSLHDALPISLHEGPERRGIGMADQQIPLPMPRHRAIGHLRRTFVDTDQVLDGARREPDLAGPAKPGPATDRKSTRLNSSHDQISYAVFCLKK